MPSDKLPHITRLKHPSPKGQHVYALEPPNWAYGRVWFRTHENPQMGHKLKYPIFSMIICNIYIIISGKPMLMTSINQCNIFPHKGFACKIKGIEGACSWISSLVRVMPLKSFNNQLHLIKCIDMSELFGDKLIKWKSDDKLKKKNGLRTIWDAFTNL